MVRVLCIDADRDGGEVTAASLRERLPDAEVTVAESGADAVAAFADNPIDCLVSAYALPDGNGVTLLREIRETAPDVPFVLFVDDGSETVASEAIAAGVSGYVRRDEQHAYDRLAERIESAVETYRSRLDRRAAAHLDDGTFVYRPRTDEPPDLDRRVREFVAGGVADGDCTLSTAIDPVADATPESILAEVMETGSERVEWRCESDAGKQFQVESRLEHVTLSDHPRVVCSLRDVTAQKRRKRRLETFRQAVEHAGHSIYVTDTDARIRYVNATFEEMTGYDASEAVGRTPRILKSGEHDQEFYRNLWSTILDGEVWRSEIVNERADGDRYVADQTIAPITDESGEIHRFVAVNAEITDRVHWEERLESLYEGMVEWLDADSPAVAARRVSEQLTDALGLDCHGVYHYDETGDRLAPMVVSERATTLLGGLPVVERGEGLAWTVFETGTASRSDDVGGDAVASDSDTDVRSELLVPLGEHGVLVVCSERVGAFDETDETLVTIIASVLTEVLNRIEREQSLQEQNSRLEEFASVVSHDLRNPLSVAKLHRELLAETGDEAHLDDIRAAHERMESIIDDLLWLARKGRGVGKTRSVSLRHVAKEGWAHVDTGDATLSAEVDTRIEADPDRLQQLFENLFRNAVEHAGPDVAVEVGLLPDGFYVSDDGPGIPEDERETVLKSGYTTETDGTGYGLSIVETIVEAHGWHLDVTEDRTGGARFEIRGPDT